MLRIIWFNQIFLLSLYSNKNNMNNIDKFKIAINVIAVTSIIGLAISYVSILLPQIPDLNFLESVGLYCMLIPVNEFLKSISTTNE